MPCILSSVNTLTDFARIERFNFLSTEGIMSCNLSNLNPLTDFALIEQLGNVSDTKVASEFEMLFIESNIQLIKGMFYIISFGNISLTYKI